MKEPLNELHLFAGAGGGILGGMLCGHTCVCAVEIEEYPRKVLLQRQRDGILPKFPIWDDVRTFDGTPWEGRVDVVCGGFPCQDISAAGKGAGIEGERSGMWVEMARIIGEIRPRYVFVENSPMLTSRGLGRVLGDLAQMGYDARWGVLGAHHTGAPHKRDRIWIVAYSTSEGLEGQQWSQHEGRRSGSSDRSEDVANASGKGLERRKLQGTLRDERHGTKAHGSTGECGGIPRLDEPCEFCGYEYDREALGRYGCPNCHGEGLDDQSGPGIWWKTEPNVGRVAHGVAARVDRLKAIGNGQVPAVASLAWETLTQIKP